MLRSISNNFSNNANRSNSSSSKMASPSSSPLQEQQDPMDFPDDTCKIFFQLLVDGKSADRAAKKIFSRLLSGNTSAMRFSGTGEMLTLTLDEVVDCKGTFRTALAMPYADHLCRLQAQHAVDAMMLMPQYCEKTLSVSATVTYPFFNNVANQQGAGPSHVFLVESRNH